MLIDPRLSIWMRGRCWDMAVALHELTALPMAGLFDDRGDCHHAFVQTTDGRGLDWCGLRPIQRLSAGCKGQIVKPISREDIAHWVGRDLSRSEINAARKACLANAQINACVELAVELARSTPAASEATETDAPSPRG